MILRSPQPNRKSVSKFLFNLWEIHSPWPLGIVKSPDMIRFCSVYRQLELQTCAMKIRRSPKIELSLIHVEKLINLVCEQKCTVYQSDAAWARERDIPTSSVTELNDSCMNVSSALTIFKMTSGPKLRSSQPTS
jgi:hypothetical protein